MSVISETIINRTIDTFQPFQSEELTRAEAVEIVQNVTELAQVLFDLNKQREKVLQKKENNHVKK